jgi:hypothetical protein
MTDRHATVPLAKLEALRDSLAAARNAIEYPDNPNWRGPDQAKWADEAIAWADAVAEKAEAQPEPDSRFDGFLAAELSSFVDQMKRATAEVAEEVIGSVETTYLPHLENDYWMNADTIAERAVLAFLGRDDQPEPREDDITIDLSRYDAKEVRAAIFRDHREAIIEAMGKDRDEEIESLKRQLEFARDYR